MEARIDVVDYRVNETVTGEVSITFEDSEASLVRVLFRDSEEFARFVAMASESLRSIKDREV